MSDALLVLNAGSSSLKFSLFLEDDPSRPLIRGQLEALQTRPRFTARRGHELILDETWPEGSRLGHEEAIEQLFRWGRGLTLGHQLTAVGHRVVHGGRRFTGPTLVDDAVVAALEAMVPLAPLHQPHNVAAIRAVARAAPGLPQVACFDTAFHARQPAIAQAFGLPRRYADAGIRRYGFHGLSCEHVSEALGGIDRRAATGRTVIAHLGSGASLTAIRHGASVATTMGFTPLDGLVMGTRCGALDPGVVLHLLEHEHLSIDDVRRVLYHESGLLGMSGVSSDMRVLLASAAPAAAEAVDLFVYRISRELGSLAAALGGLDALVFTGGIGENAPVIRERVCHDAAWLGVHLDGAANADGGLRISTMASRVSVWVVPTDEEAVIARHTQRLTGERTPAPETHGVMASANERPISPERIDQQRRMS